MNGCPHLWSPWSAWYCQGGPFERRKRLCVYCEAIESEQRVVVLPSDETPSDQATRDVAPIGMDDLLLWQLAEECAEIVQAVSKAQRFGLDENGQGRFTPNKDRIVEEIQDLRAIVEMLHERGVFDARPDRDAIESKKEKVLRFAALSCREGRIR